MKLRTMKPERPRKDRLTAANRSGVIIALVGVCCAVCLVAWSGSSPDSVNPTDLVATTFRIRGAKGVPPTQATDFIWRQPQIVGPVTKEIAEEVINNDKAEVLEKHLANELRQQLNNELVQVTTTLQDASAQYERITRQIKAQVRRDESKIVRITSKPREQDVNYPRLLEARASVAGGHGAVWGEVHDGTEIHHIVTWSEWPELRALLELQAALVEERSRIVADWISHRYNQSGLGLFK